jgi:DNA replication protein DnaC
MTIIPDTVAIDVEGLLRRLHLPTIRRLLPVYASQAASEGWGYRDFLARLVAEEVANRNNTRIQKAARRARFPSLKTIEDFDFTYQTSLKRQMISPFLDPDFVGQGRNLILLGPSGTGKTHLCCAIAYKAIQHGHDARFVRACDLIDILAAGSTHGQLREVTKEFLEPQVLIIDEVGYLHHASAAANVLYGLVDARHQQRRPMLFTTNKPTTQWGEVLHDHQLAEAILDRVLERGTLIELRGRSYRTKHHRHLGQETGTGEGQSPEQIGMG